MNKHNIIKKAFSEFKFPTLTNREKNGYRKYSRANTNNMRQKIMEEYANITFFRNEMNKTRKQTVQYRNNHAAPSNKPNYKVNLPTVPKLN